MGKRFEDLSKEEIEYIIFVYNEDMEHKEKMEILTKKFGKSERTIRRWWKNKLNLSERYSTLPRQIQDAQKRVIKQDTDIILFTAAQNKTGVNTKFLKNLLAYSEYLETNFNKKVEIVIAPSRYRNPTSPTEESKQKGEQWWVDEVLPYLHYGKVQFGDTIISSNTRIRPTAKEPLTGYEVLAKDSNLVIPHSKIHFRTLPRFKNNPLRSMSTTGFITNKNYSDSRAGETAWEHHSYGFVIVEKKKDGICHIPRNVKVKQDGGFIDIIYNVENGEVNKIKKSEGFVWGDIHASEINPDVFQKTLDLYDILKPKKTVLHDVLDSSTMNPHETKDMYIQKRKIVENRYMIDAEIEHSFETIKQIKATGSKVYISLSNHDNFLDRHINDGNWKNDLHNSHNYLKYALIQQTEDLEEYGNIYGYLLFERFGKKVKYLKYGDSLSIEGYECALHGDNGTNGSRGSYKQFSRLNTKMISAHSHSPVLHNGVTVVGVTCNLRQYYTRKGLSSWAYAHSVIHPNGKNQLLVMGDDLMISDLI